MKKTLVTLLLASVAGMALAGQPLERFRGAERFSFTFGDNAARYGKTDSNIKIEIDAFILGTQVIDTTGGADELAVNKTRGSLNFQLKLSDLNILFPPETITLVGSATGGEGTKHVTDAVLPGPYRLTGTIEGVDYDLTLRNVRVLTNVDTVFSNTVTAPALNPILNAICDVQGDQLGTGSTNSIIVRPGNVSGWIVSPVFTVSRVSVDVTNIQQTLQIPERSIAPSRLAVRLGRLDAGDVSSLAAIDGNSLRVCRFIVPNQAVAPITVEVSGTAASTDVEFLDLLVTSRMTVNGLFSQTLDLFDWSTNTFSTTDVRTDSTNTTFATRKLSATGSVSRYVNPGDLTVTGRYRVRQTGPAASPAWCNEVDQFRWVVTP